MSSDQSGNAAWIVAAVVAVVIGLPLLLLLLVLGEEDEEDSDTGAQCEAADVSDEDADTAGIPEEYADLVSDAAAESGLSVELLAAQIEAESGWDEQAESPVGARGIAQFMPETWESYGEGGDITDPDDAIPAMGRYMGALQDEVSDIAGNEEELAELTLAAYNAGPGAVQEHDGIPPFNETQDYVSKIMDSAQGSFSVDCSPVGGQEIGELGTGEWTHPLPGGQVTSGFGSRGCPIPEALNCNDGVSDHRGIDFGSPPPHGEIVAPMDLEIRATGVIDGWEQLGWVVLAKMPEDPGLHVEFAHCVPDSIKVEPGDTVAPGTPMCDEGTSGASEAPHLHLQFGTPDGDEDIPGWENLIDPEPLLEEKGVL